MRTVYEQSQLPVRWDAILRHCSNCAQMIGRSMWGWKNLELDHKQTSLPGEAGTGLGAACVLLFFFFSLLRFFIQIVEEKKWNTTTSMELHAISHLAWCYRFIRFLFVSLPLDTLLRFIFQVEHTRHKLQQRAASFPRGRLWYPDAKVRV